MATKAEERKALEQIRKIVAGLGEESYVGRAFEGCFEMAADNIDNDFWNSMKEQRDTCSKGEFEANKEVALLKARAEKVENLFNQKCETATKYYTAWKDAENGWRNCYNEQVTRANEAEEKAEKLELENMKLKARLYDMMTAGK